ncbi:MAG: ATPase, partial [Odoribacter sp.]|nr:ATPase [Odoribacter sp.]
MVFYKDYQKFLEELRDRGVVHIYENKQRSSEDETLQGKLRFVKRISEMIRMLENRGVKDDVGKAEVPEEELLSYLEGQFHRQEQIAARLGELEKAITLYEPWGTFSTERVA